MTALFCILHPRRARARRHVTTTWNRLLSGDTSVIADIPPSCRARVLDAAWDSARASAWDAVNQHYNEAQTNATAAAYDIEGTP
jgi:hypothetical protein